MLIIKNDEDFFNLISNSESGLVKPIPVVLKLWNRKKWVFNSDFRRITKCIKRWFL